MSVFSRACSWGLSDGVLVSMLADVRGELLGAALLLPLAHADPRNPVCATITCSDAAPTRAGTVTGQGSSSCAEALLDHSEHKGKYTRLDWGPAEWQLQPWSVPQLPDALGCAIASVPWVVDRCFSLLGLIVSVSKRPAP